MVIGGKCELVGSCYAKNVSHTCTQQAHRPSNHFIEVGWFSIIFLSLPPPKHKPPIYTRVWERFRRVHRSSPVQRLYTALLFGQHRTTKLHPLFIVLPATCESFAFLEPLGLLLGTMFSLPFSTELACLRLAATVSLPSVGTLLLFSRMVAIS